MDVFSEITNNSSFHNSNNYQALDKISTHVHNAWNWCSEKNNYNSKELYHDTIPMDFVEELCNQEDWEAANLKTEVDILCKK